MINRQHIENYIKNMEKVVTKLPLDEIMSAVDAIIDAYKREKTIYIIGNGGSASISSHYATDLNKCRASDGIRVKAISMVDNVALMTALSNDEGYENVFSEQIKPLISSGDILIAISGSGNSPNVVNACNVAKKSGAKIIGLTGFNGGKLREISNISVHVDDNHYGRIEDAHSVIGHLIVDYIKTVEMGKKISTDWKDQRNC